MLSAKLGGLKLTARAIRPRATVPVPDSNDSAVSWLRRCRVGDNQGQVGACSIFTFANWREVMEGVAISDEDCVVIYQSACEYLGQGDEGLSFPQAFAACQRAGWFPGKKMIEVSDGALLPQQPLISGWIVNGAIRNVNYFGCMDHTAGDTPQEGGHAMLWVARGSLSDTDPTVYNVQEQSWGLQGGGGNLGLVFEQDSLFHRLCTELWAIVDDAPAPPPTPAPVPEPVPGPVSGPLCDPDPARYTPESLDTRYEEVGLEVDSGFPVRFHVYFPSCGKWFCVSSLGKGQVFRDTPAGLRCDDFVRNGYAYHVRGGRNDEPQNESNPTIDVMGNRNLPHHIMVECRKVH